MDMNSSVLKDFDSVRDACSKWLQTLRHIKRANPPEDFTWYGYDIMANIWHMDKLLDKTNRDILARVASMPVADIGAADGDLGFFFEHLGFEVDIVDWPLSNWNGLRGAKRLKTLLESRAAIHEIDLDNQFHLPRDRYGLVCLFGILYHLKNPFFILERLAHSARYCLLSTRVARQTVDGTLHLDTAPLAYLLAPDECNNDATNYWIFSMPGLVRLAQRSGWQIVRSMTVGDTANSNPSSPEHDERAFLLLESNFCRPSA